MVLILWLAGKTRKRERALKVSSEFTVSVLLSQTEAVTCLKKKCEIQTHLTCTAVTRFYLQETLQRVSQLRCSSILFSQRNRPFCIYSLCTNHELQPLPSFLIKEEEHQKHPVKIAASTSLLILLLNFRIT